MLKLILVSEEMFLGNEATSVNLTITSNEKCETAASVPMEGGTYTGVMRESSTTESNVPACGSSAAQSGAGAFYKIIGSGQLMRADTCSGTVIDTQISVFTGSCGTNLECIVGNDNACGSQSSVGWNSIEGQEYYIFVQGESGEIFTLNIESERVPIPQNDICQNAELLQVPTGGESLNVTVQLKGSTNDPENFQLGCQRSVNGQERRGVWYEYIGDGRTISVSVESSSSSTQASLTLFEGSCDMLHCAGAFMEYKAGTWTTELAKRYLIWVGFYRRDFRAVGDEYLIVQECQDPSYVWGPCLY